MNAVSASAGIGVSGWVACRFDDLTLLFSRDDVAEQITAADLEIARGGGLEVGWLLWEDSRWPAYRLDRDLRPVDWEFDGSKTVMPVCANGQARGIVCDQVRSFDHPGAVVVHPLPGCLRRDGSPLAGLGLYETLRVGAVVEAETLIRFLNATVPGA
jgi:hypothetical protein